MSRDPKDQKDPAPAKAQQTRLNHELAHRYAQQGGRRKKPAPGQSSLTEDLAEPSEAEVEAAEPEHDEEHATAETPVQATEPRRSLFELPRKEATKAPLPATAPASPAAPSTASSSPAAPATPPKPTGSGSRRG